MYMTTEVREKRREKKIKKETREKKKKDKKRNRWHFKWRRGSGNGVFIDRGQRLEVRIFFGFFGWFPC